MKTFFPIISQKTFHRLYVENRNCVQMEFVDTSNADMVDVDELEYLFLNSEYDGNEIDYAAYQNLPFNASCNMIAAKSLRGKGTDMVMHSELFQKIFRRIPESHFIDIIGLPIIHISDKCPKNKILYFYYKTQYHSIDGGFVLTRKDDGFALFISDDYENYIYQNIINF